MGTLYLQNHALSVKKIPKRTPRQIIKFSNGAPKALSGYIGKSVSVFSHGGDRVGEWLYDKENEPAGLLRDAVMTSCDL